MNKIHTTLGSLALTTAFVLMPFAASAATANASSTTGVLISPSGMVRVIGADVTAVGNGFIDAATTIGGTVLNWIVNISASTKIGANGSNTATTTDVKVGDKVSFAGTVSSSIGTTLSVTASKIRDITTFPFRHMGQGVVASVDTANGSFVINKGDKAVTVQTNASTTISVNGSPSTLAGLQVGQRVAVIGTPNTDGSVITATNVVVRDPSVKKTELNEDKNGDNDNDDHGKTSVNAQAETHADANASRKDGHNGLNILGGLHLGFGKDN